MSKVTLAALRIRDEEEKNYFNSWAELVYYFPQIKTIRKNGVLIDVHLPSNYQRLAFSQVNNKVYTLIFTVPRTEEEILEGKEPYRTIKYESPLATKSVLMDLLRQ